MGGMVHNVWVRDGVVWKGEVEKSGHENMSETIVATSTHQ